MKNINKIFSLAFVAILTTVTFTSCEYDEDKARFPQLTNGGFVKFVSAPEFDMGADPATASFNAMTEDPNGNVATYEVTVVGDFDGAPSDPLAFGSTTTFPYDVSFTTADMAELFGVDASVFVEDDSFEFFGVVTTVDGSVYDGTAPSGTTSGQEINSLLRTDLYSGGGATTNTYVGNNVLDGDYNIFSAAEGEVVDADTQLVISGAGVLASGDLIAQTTLTSIGNVNQTVTIATDTDGAGSGVALSITGNGTNLVSVIPVANGNGYPFGYASGDTITITESNLQAQGFEGAVGDLVVTLVTGNIVSSTDGVVLRLTVLDGTITEIIAIGSNGPSVGMVLTASTSALDATASNSGTGTGTLVVEITAAQTDAGTWNGGQTNGVLTSAPGLLDAFNWEVSFEDAN